MIEWIVTDCDGGQFTLPHPAQWRLDYAMGTPCDGFSVKCPWQTGQEAVLEKLCRVTVRDGAEILFTGVVDECECLWSEAGTTLEINGRSMQALLLDNEAGGADFAVATLDEILRRYVLPYGIVLGETVQLPTAQGFSVVTGSSCWQVLYQFAAYHAGALPRFDKRGRLLLSKPSDIPAKKMDAKLPVTRLLLRHKRYGVLSDITVVNRVSMASQKIVSESFARKGGSASRVYTMPRTATHQTMRYNGQFQLQKSARELLRVELTVGEAFLASPGEVILVENTALPICGQWRVVECSVTLGAAGYKSTLTLAPPEVLL